MHYIQLSGGKRVPNKRNFILWSIYILVVKMITTENKQDFPTYQLYTMQTEYRLFSLCCCECVWKLSLPSLVLCKDNVTCSSTKSHTRYHKLKWPYFASRGLMLRILFIVLRIHVLSRNTYQKFILRLTLS